MSSCFSSGPAPSAIRCDDLFRDKGWPFMYNTQDICALLLWPCTSSHPLCYCMLETYLSVVPTPAQPFFPLEHRRPVFQGKIYNCGGGGSCGTCAVDVIAGASNCSPKGPGEKKLLDKNKKPASYRLSCCTMVSGPVTVKTKP